MKRDLIYLFLIVAAIAAAKVTAQTTPETPAEIRPQHIEAGFTKTVHILFPSPVTYIDIGSMDIIAGKADGAENVVRVKAAVRNFAAETNLMKAEKRAYEKVIRMIAHEVNNTTAGITSTLDTVEQALSTEENMEDICEVMRVCTERCFSMSRFITRFADVVKIPEPTVAQVQLNELVSMCKRFMEGMCNDRNIILRLECDPEVGQVRLDASLFEQVLVNIIKNAAESIESAGEAAGKQGEITVRTTAPALIEIVDNGPGISKETEAKLFSPFFSTKPNGQGIGLVFIREVLSRHGCAFSLRTYNDGLTRFRILFN